VDSIPGAPVRFRDERGPFRDDRGERVGQLTQVPNELLGPLRDYAAQHDLTKRSADSFCVSVLNHLSNSNEFDYSLRATQSDMNIDPVLDFLFNRKEGHCEYFASSMALLLRAHDVPARVVNGFKGGDRNELFGPSLVVRQKHAHSWVEALLPTADKSDYVWTSFDPTPGPGRQRVVALVNPTPTLVRQVRDISRQLWSDYVLNFNSSEQETAVYGPARRLIVEKGRQVIKGLHDMWKRRNARFNWVAAFAASGLMLVVILGGRYLARMLARRQPALLQNSQPGIGGFWGRLLGLMRGWVNRLLVRMSDANSRVAFYDEMLRTLESFGLSKKPTWTAFRFAEHARVELEANPAVSSAAHIPIELVDRYYRVRFGHESLNPSETDEVQRLLGQLGSTLKRQ
jgi:hypothetical protein